MEEESPRGLLRLGEPGPDARSPTVNWDDYEFGPMVVTAKRGYR